VANSISSYSNPVRRLSAPTIIALLLIALLFIDLLCVALLFVALPFVAFHVITLVGIFYSSSLTPADAWTPFSNNALQESMAHQINFMANNLTLIR